LRSVRPRSILRDGAERRSTWCSGKRRLVECKYSQRGRSARERRVARGRRTRGRRRVLAALGDVEIGFLGCENGVSVYTNNIESRRNALGKSIIASVCALERHRRVSRENLRRCGGRLVDTQLDRLLYLVLFSGALDDALLERG
ncbi:hypothetical protein PFISCL1PPCAC_23864, partial [Pristionchus fissidentatus]